MSDAVTAAVLIIGNEVLSGRTKDANLSHLGERLNAHGIRVVEARVVRDDEAAIVEAVNALRARCDYVFTTGGIGPTHDDITAACVAKALGRDLVRNPDAVKRLEAHYRGGDIDLTEARLRMANTPAGDDVELLDNPVSGAPGFRCENVFVLPGVPRIMQAIVDLLLSRLSGGAVVESRTVAAYIPEGDLADPLAAVQAAHPQVEIGSYPYFRAGRFGASLVLRSTDAAALAACEDAVRDMVRALGAEPLEAPDA
jgi:molybdenum cofactor synthesis domain-containing protein